jgi:predicted DNA-binding WGR domain protein
METELAAADRKAFSLETTAGERPAEPVSSSPGPSSSDERFAAGGTGPGTITLSDGATRYLEYVHGASSKFWEITVSGNTYTVRFGRIGTSGQQRTKSFPDHATARHQAGLVLARKLGKGYLPRTPDG